MFMILLLAASCSSPKPEPTTTDSPASIADTGAPIEIVPGTEPTPVDLTDANPVDPTTTFKWRFEISDAEVDLLNAAAASGYYSDVDSHIYGYADSISATTMDGISSIVFEKPEVEIGGEMNLCTLPCKAQLIVDLNENVDDQAMGGYDNIKFGNLLYGGAYAEYWMYNTYFPNQGVNSPMAAYAWVEPSYLGYLPLDYLAMEMTKEDFLNNTYGPGNWLMAYEGYGDIGNGSSNYPSCQAGVCDDAVLTELDTDINTSIENGMVIDFLDRRYLGGHERFFAFCAAEKMVGQWDGYCDASHNYTMVIVANPENPSQPFIDLVEHSLDLALSPTWDYSWYGVFGNGYIVQACRNSTDGCADAYVDYLEAKNEEWAANVEVFEAQLDAQNEYLTSIDMQYDDYPQHLADNKSYIEGRHDSVATMIENYRNPCAAPDTGWYGGWGGGGYDTGIDPCAIVDTGFGSDTGSGYDTAALPADDTAAGDTGL